MCIHGVIAQLRGSTEPSPAHGSTEPSPARVNGFLINPLYKE